MKKEKKVMEVLTGLKICGRVDGCDETCDKCPYNKRNNMRTMRSCQDRLIIDAFRVIVELRNLQGGIADNGSGDAPEDHS